MLSFLSNKNNTPNQIPDPAFLVIGISKKYEDNKLRTIYNNPSYYFLDVSNPRKNTISEEGRFIHCDFNNPLDLKRVHDFFKEMYIIRLLTLVEKGGYIIIPDYNFFLNKLSNGMSIEEYLRLSKNKKENIRIREKILKIQKTFNILSEFKKRFSDIKIMKINEIRDAIIQSRNVYNEGNNNNVTERGFVITK
jgi:hypothetical protein